MTRLRVMTYNIWQGGRRGAVLAEAIRAADPDVLLVNETPKTPWLWQGRCLRLAEAWGMRYVVGGRSAGANMILVRPAVVVESTHAQVVPQPVFRPRRGIAVARLHLDGSAVGVVSCHLSLDGGSRPAEVRQVVQVADRLRGTVIVGGDLNERPGGPSWRALVDAGYADHGTDAWQTFPAPRPVRRIDAVLVRGDAVVVHHGDPGVDEGVLGQASDHRPVLVELEV